TLKELISQTMVRWSQEDQIQDPELVRIMYSLLRRQYDSIGELLQALRKAYTISAASVKDTINLLAALGQIRSLLSVRMGKEEELLMINGLGYGINRILFLSCTAVYLLANVLLRRICSSVSPAKLLSALCPVINKKWNDISVNKHILCRKYQAVCASGLGFSNSLVILAVRIIMYWLQCIAFGESIILSPAVVTYLAGCGLQSCPVLLAKGYPDIGWNPIEGERYLSFLRFAVFANSESVEENASVVVKLLIR
ncbi:RYR3 protein, partial [Machaerirhynchus nigripectus]|nr:RYR3 protein [Machaerirhynchus nigripectus]